MRCGRRSLDAYRTLGTGAQGPCVRVAVRSSATAEDTASSSFAGMNRTFTNVSGEDAVVARVVDCWASLFGERVLAYRSVQGVVDEPAIAVVVQQMVDSDRSGVMFSADPATGDRSLVVIEAAWGLGEVVVSGAVEPDTYVVAKDGPRLVSTRVGNKTSAIERDADGQERRRELEPAEAMRRVLSDDEVLDLARLGLRVEAHYGEPQDMEWAYAGGDLYLVQSRPITTLSAEPEAPAAAGHVPPGAGAGPWRAAGQGPRRRARRGRGPGPGAAIRGRRPAPRARRGARGADDDARLGPDDAAGGRARHRRRGRDVSRRHREPGAPGAVRRRYAARDPSSSATASSSPSTGLRARSTKATSSASLAAPPQIVDVVARPEAGESRAVEEPLATRLYVNLAIAERAEEVAALPVDGVGLLRAEFMITDALGGAHPRHLHGARRERRLRRSDGGVPLAHHTCVRAPAGRLPHDRLPHQRVPEPGGRRELRADRGEPDDRVPRLLPLRVRARPLPPRARAARPGPRGDPEPAPHDPLRAHPLGARGGPRPRRREPARPPAGAAPLGDGRGALGRLPHPGVRHARDRRRVDRFERPHAAHARRRPRLRDVRRAVRRVRRRRARRDRPHRDRAPTPPGSRRRCAARRRRPTRSSRSISSASGSPRSR